MNTDTDGPILGLDLSLTSSGVVVLQRDGTFEAFTLPSGKPKPKGHDRLVLLRDQLTEITGWAKPSVAVIEDLPVGGRGAGRTGMAQGVAREVLHRAGVPFSLVVPSTLKKSATGDGRADKVAMREALPGDVGKGLKNTDETDAYWLAQVGAFYAGWPHHLAHTDNLKELVLQS